MIYRISLVEEIWPKEFGGYDCNCIKSKLDKDLASSTWSEELTDSASEKGEFDAGGDDDIIVETLTARCFKPREVGPVLRNPSVGDSLSVGEIPGFCQSEVRNRFLPLENNESQRYEGFGSLGESRERGVHIPIEEPVDHLQVGCVANQLGPREELGCLTQKVGQLVLDNNVGTGSNVGIYESTCDSPLDSDSEQNLITCLPSGDHDSSSIFNDKVAQISAVPIVQDGHLEEASRSLAHSVALGDSLFLPEVSILRNHPQNWVKKQRPSSSSESLLSGGARREVHQFVLSLSDYLSDSGVANCNRRFWLQNVELEARNLWTLGKEIGVRFTGNEDEIVEKLIAMEQRDHNGWSEFIKKARGGVEESDP